YLIAANLNADVICCRFTALPVPARSLQKTRWGRDTGDEISFPVSICGCRGEDGNHNGRCGDRLRIAIYLSGGRTGVRAKVGGLVALSAVLILSSVGCATRKYARNRVNERMAPLEQRTGELEETSRRNTQDIGRLGDDVKEVRGRAD